ncbi:MAG: T9SS type A sorting domain-containing protein [Saprospiraceae bacterium]|nr:T9SS type A sorting domain-containing protein [Saprospiraceae bacterium]
MKKFIYSFIFSLILTIGIKAQTPYTGQAVIGNGETFIVLSNMTITSLSIQDGGRLIINTGVNFSYSGNLVMNGILELNPGSGIFSTGSLQTGFGAQSSARIIMHKNSFFATTGSWTQYNPTIGEAILEMDDNTAVEICGTYTQFKTSSPYVHYTGTNKNAYFINKAPASGMGTNELGDHSNIEWIVMDQLANLTSGEAQLCGPYAKESDCPGIWPTWLDDKNTCFESYEVGQAPLPVSWINFSATIKSENVVLQWTTAEEKKNSGFYIQTSQDGENWQTLGFVASRTDRNALTGTNNYSYIVSKPSAGNHLYRLEQVDSDGGSSFSHIRSVSIGNHSTIDLFPNPVVDQLTIVANGIQEVSISDIHGNFIRKITSVGDQRITLSMADLQSGIYIIQIASKADGSINNYKVVKQ